MNAFQTVLLLNQGVQTAQLNAIHSRLASQEQMMAEAKNAQERVNAARQAVFHFKTTIEELAQDVSETTWIYYQLRYTRHELARNGIRKECFTEFRDLEYYQEVVRRADEFEGFLCENIDSEAVKAIDAFVKVDRAVPLYANLAVWARVYRLMPNVTLIEAWDRNKVVGVGIAVVLFSEFIWGAFGIIPFSLGLGICVGSIMMKRREKVRRKYIERVISPITTPFGINLVDLTKENVSAAIARDEAQLQALCFARYNLLDYPKAYANVREWMLNTIERYRLPLHIKLPALSQ